MDAPTKYKYLLWVDYGQGEGWTWYGANTIPELVALMGEKSGYPQVVTRLTHLRVTVEDDDDE